MLLAILFNTGGYYFFFQYMIGRSDQQAIDRINHNHYRNADLVEVKIPVSMPTQPEQSDYMIVAGQVQFKNRSYNYAEMKITRDTLYLLVVPNGERTRLINANVIYAKQVNDIPFNKKTGTFSVKKEVSASETPVYVSDCLQTRVHLLATYPDYRSYNLPKPFLTVPVQPPDALTLQS